MSSPRPPHRTDPDLLAVARGDRPADLLLTGGQVVDVFSRQLVDASVAVYGERIASVGPAVEATETVDVGGAIIAPGFIDAHMHIESTMMLPPQFVSVAVPHGTTGVVLDPHEIANVLGVPGIRFLMDAARGLPMNLWFAASSCVPASPLETAGATLEAEDLRPLFDDDRIIALAEMMNFPGVVNAVPAVLDKVRLGLDRRLVDGHCPGLTGGGLQAYVAAGISSDHECTTAEEALEKLRLGMRVYLREGSAAKNLEALLPAVTTANAHRFSFCTDDRHPGDLVDEGHIDHVVRKAIALGLDPVTAVAMASRHTAEHYGQLDVGAVAPGCFADLIVLDDLREIRCRQVLYHGRLTAENGTMVGDVDAGPIDISGVTGTVHLPDGFDESALAVAGGGAATIRVIGMDPHQLVTTDLRLEPRTQDGRYVADVERDVLKLAVIERHRGTGNVGVGFVRGFGLRRGAIASTVGHDAHNLIVVGTNDRDMVVAARALADVGGGQCAVCDGAVSAVLPLPIAGLLSDAPVPTLVKQQQAVLDASRALGCDLHDPFMPLSFMSLSVIPKLKLSDRGLVDVDEFDFVPLEA